MERVSVKAQIAEVVGKLGRPVRAKYFAWLDSPHCFDELIVIGMIRKRQRMIHTKTILPGFVLGPTRDRDRSRFAQPRQAEFARRSWQRNDGMTVQWLALIQA